MNDFEDLKVINIKFQFKGELLYKVFVIFVPIQIQLNFQIKHTICYSS